MNKNPSNSTIPFRFHENNVHHYDRLKLGTSTIWLLIWYEQYYAPLTQLCQTVLQKFMYDECNRLIKVLPNSTEYNVSIQNIKQR